MSAAAQITPTVFGGGVSYPALLVYGIRDHRVYPEHAAGITSFAAIVNGTRPSCTSLPPPSADSELAMSCCKATKLASFYPMVQWLQKGLAGWTSRARA